MGYKVFTAGEEALASDVNSLLMSQTVARFASAAARTSALTAPVLNQLSILDSRAGVVQYWTGSAWADVAPLIQSGIVTGATSDAGGQYLLTFPRAFASPPAVTVANMAALFQLITLNGSSSATAVQFRAYSAPGTPVAGGTVLQFHWQAIGVAP